MNQPQKKTLPELRIGDIWVAPDGIKYVVEGTYSGGKANLESLLDETDRIAVPLDVLFRNWRHEPLPEPDDRDVFAAMVRYGNDDVTTIGLCGLGDGIPDYATQIRQGHPELWESYQNIADDEDPLVPSADEIAEHE